MERELPRAVEIRRAGSSDAPQIATVLHQAFVQYQPLYTPEALPQRRRTLDKFYRALMTGRFG